MQEEQTKSNKYKFCALNHKYSKQLEVLQVILQCLFFVLFFPHIETDVEAVIFNGLGLAGEKK